jgi:hypothetical protein
MRTFSGRPVTSEVSATGCQKRRSYSPPGEPFFDMRQLRIFAGVGAAQ